MYTDQELTELIACEKRISAPPRKELRIEGQMLRNDMDLQSLDGRESFHVFMRQSRQLPENFSIGLTYISASEPGNICLIRYNGMHGGSVAHPHHATCHIHRCIAEDVNAGIRIERHIVVASDYAAYRDALRSFLLATGVQSTDLATHFPGIMHDDLFGEEMPL
jgi:hypothetical protein